MIKERYELTATDSVTIKAEWRPWQKRWLVTIEYWGYSGPEPKFVETFLSEQRPVDSIANDSNGRTYLVEHIRETLTRRNG